MGKIDYTFPLPIKNLHKRYDKAFSALSKNLCSTIVGIPLSSRGGYLKFILESEIIDEFVDTKKYDFLVIDHYNLHDSDLLKFLLIKISQKLNLSLSDNFDYLVAQATIENELLYSKSSKKLIILIPDFYDLLKDKPETTDFLQRIWKINKHNLHKAGILYLLTASQKEIDRVNIDFYLDFREIVNEKIINFDLLNESEILYTKSRLEFFRNTKISEKVNKLAVKLSGGHYVLYKTLTSFNEDELIKISKTLYHPTLQVILNEIWNGSEEIFTPLLPPKKVTNNMSQNLLPFTSYEHEVFKYLEENIEKIITRDEIAKIVWKGNWEEKYSDWAIDKLISKLKSKLVYSNFRILTFRNQGYKLTKYD